MVYLKATIALAPGKVNEFNQLMAGTLIPLMEKHGAKFVGSWITVDGEGDEVMDLWRFDSFAHYREVTKATSKDKEFMAIAPTISSIVVKETVRLLSPLPCSLLK